MKKQFFGGERLSSIVLYEKENNIFQFFKKRTRPIISRAGIERTTAFSDHYMV